MFLSYIGTMPISDSFTTSLFNNLLLFHYTSPHVAWVWSQLSIPGKYLAFMRFVTSGFTLFNSRHPCFASIALLNLLKHLNPRPPFSLASQSLSHASHFTPLPFAPPPTKRHSSVSVSVYQYKFLLEFWIDSSKSWESFELRFLGVLTFLLLKSIFASNPEFFDLYDLVKTWKHHSSFFLLTWAYLNNFLA